MGALPEAQAPALLDLAQVRARQLEGILGEELRTWQELLDWDFQPSADLVRN